MSWIDLESDISDEFAASYESSAAKYNGVFRQGIVGARMIADFGAITIITGASAIQCKCGATVDRDGRLCSSCFAISEQKQRSIDRNKYRESHRLSIKKYRAKLESMSTCIVCASERSVDGSKKCSECRSDVAQYNTARHHKLKDAGKCASCNKSSDRPGKAYCSGCTKVRRDRWRAKYSKAAKEARVNA